MDNEKQKKQNEKTKQWILPEEVEVIETRDPKQMIDKWLAAAACKTWTETFIDDDTKETVEIERKELLIGKGTYCSQDVVQQIMFLIQSEEIKSVWVMNMPPLNERSEPYPASYIVSVSSLSPTTDYIYVSGVQSPEEAAGIVTDYCAVYSTPNKMGNYTVNDCQLTPIIYLYDHQAKARAEILKPRTRLLDHVEDECPRPRFTETLRFWNIGITKWTFDDFEGWKPYKQTICTEAYDMHQAVQIVERWVKTYFEATDIKNWVLDVTKVGKSKITHVIPSVYIKLWQSKNHTKKEGGEA